MLGSSLTVIAILSIVAYLLIREHASCVFITAKGEAVSFPVAA